MNCNTPKNFSWSFYFIDKIGVAIVVALVIGTFNYYTEKSKALNTVNIEDTNKAMAEYDNLLKHVANYRSKMEQINKYKMNFEKEDPNRMKKLNILQDEARELLNKYDSAYLVSKLTLGEDIIANMNMYMQLLQMYYKTRDQLMFDEISESQKKSVVKLYSDMENILNNLELTLNRQNIRSYIMATQYH